MDADLKKIKKFVQFMRKEGVLTLKSAGIELSLSPDALQTEEPRPVAALGATPDMKDEPSMTEEEALFWSSPGHIPTSEVSHG